MANIGKFIDRSPIICPAGKQTERGEHVPDCMQEYTVNDSIDAVKHDIGIFKEKNDELPPYRPQPIKSNRSPGIYDEIKPLLHPPNRMRFRTLIESLQDTMFKSFWTSTHGQVKDPVGGLPKGMEPLEVTFGKPTDRSTTVQQLVNPRKTYYEILWDSQVGHDMYKKTHSDYNPGERVDRNYLKPPFDPDKRYGMKTNCNPKETLVRCLCKWHLDDPIYTLSAGQADFVEKTRYKLGKALEPNKNIECVPKGHAFGIRGIQPLYGIKELLRDPDLKPCLFKIEFDKWVAHLNHCREFVKKIKHRKNFNLEDLFNKILYYDKDKTGWISLDIFYKMCLCDDLTFDKQLIEALLDFLGYLDKCCVFYRGFLDILDVNKPLPTIKKIQDVPETNLYYVTSSAAAGCDYLYIDNSKMQAAGAFGNEHTLPGKPEGGCEADIGSLGSETLAEQILYPSIYTTYGLSHRDFFKPRSPEIIRKLFENIGYQFTDDTFDGLWKIALERDKTGSVCVDTFYNLLQESVPRPFLVMQEKECPEKKSCNC